MKQFKKYAAVAANLVFLFYSLPAVAISTSDAEAAVQFQRQPGDTRSDAQFQADCAAGIGLSSCVTPSTPKGCPAGQVWSTAGSGIAHCVGVDPLCGSSADLMRDFLGNPQCVSPTITYENQVGSCPTGYSGQLTQQRSVTTRATGVVEYGSWTTTQDLCVPPPPAPPPAPPPVVVIPPVPPSTGGLGDGEVEFCQPTKSPFNDFYDDGR